MKQTMKRNILNVAAGLAAAAVVAGGAAHGASAIVEQAKDQCVVGEQADGYLGFVPGKNADEALRREVRDINQQRKAYYADLARRNGVPIEVTATLTAEKLIGQARSGQCVRDQNGEWIEI